MLWLGVMAFSGYYWVNIHLYENDPTKTTLERWARYMGILAIMFMTVGLFTTTRIRLWSDCFMVSVEHLVVYHKFFMALMLLAGYIHMILWIVFWVETSEPGANSNNMIRRQSMESGIYVQSPKCMGV